MEAFVRAKAAEMGVDLSGVNPPVLVRRLRSDMSLKTLYGWLNYQNRPSILQRSAVEQAEADATTLVSSELLEIMETGESGDLSLASNRTFMNSFIERTGDQSCGYPMGLRRLKHTLAFAVLLWRLCSRVTPNYRDFLRLVFERGSSEDGIGVKREIDGITRAAPQLVRLARRNPDYALNTQLAPRLLAIHGLSEYRGNPEGVEAFIAQGDMFAERDMLSGWDTASNRAPAFVRVDR